MKKFQTVEHAVYEWPCRSNSDRPSKSHSKEEKKETPEEMIRSLQGIFCKGRYRSWALSPEKPAI